MKIKILLFSIILTCMLPKFSVFGQITDSLELDDEGSDSVLIDEVIITGVFDSRTRMNAPVAITILKSELIEQQNPNSAADLLKNVPGVYVNSSLGEIRNNVSSRGISAGSADGTFAYEYISMQEDGLPITNTTYFNYGPDFFLRADATISQIDAVRGGPASITAANAPGGIFNYISKTGSNTFNGEFRTKYGVQGANNSGYYRADLDFGGPLGGKWYYNVGGFYRYDQGARYAGYPFNNGGQVKANIMKKYNTGNFKVFLKYLDDTNGYAQLIPTRGYTDPEPAEGFNSSSSVLIPDLSYSSPDYIHGGEIDYRSKRLVGSIYRSAAINWEQELGKDWKLNLASKYANNAVRQNSLGYSFVSSISDLTSYYLMGALGVGNYSFTDALTGVEVANVSAGIGGSGVPEYLVNLNNLPNQSLQENSIFISPLNYYENKVQETMNQLTINKKINDMSFSFGGYFGHSDVWRFSGINGIALTTIENRPRMLNLTLAGVTIANPTLPGLYQITNGDGFLQGAAGVNDLFEYNSKQTQVAAFFGHTWDITEQLTLDWGIRWENVHVKGDNTRTYTEVDPNGGTDGDFFTLYNNNISPKQTTAFYDKKFDNFSYSGAINYKFSNRFALYGRYSHGTKNPDLDVYFAASTPERAMFLDPQQRTTEQIELGIKLKSKIVDAFVTPFYSLLSNVPVGAIGTATDGSLYTVETLYNKNETLGVEVETYIKPWSFINIRAVVTLQDPKVKEGYYWNLNSDGEEDDVIESYSGTTIAYTPKIMANVTPNFTFGKLFAFITWSYMGEREGNNINTFALPDFSQFDLGAGYNVNENLSFMVNVNNVFDTYGVMSYQRPGTLNDQLAGFEGFTAEQYQEAIANNTPYFTVAIQPISAFFTVVYKF